MKRHDFLLKKHSYFLNTVFPYTENRFFLQQKVYYLTGSNQSILLYK